MSTRQEKLKGLLKEEISDILRRELKDPRLGFVTVTDAEISPDLSHARVFVTVMGSQEERETNMAVLKKAERFVRRAFGKRVKMKVLPEIEFQFDDSVDRGIRMFELLEQIRHEVEDEDGA